MWSNMSLPCLPPLQVLDAFMTEVGQRFSTRTEERLLAVVYTLQQRTYKTGLPANAAVPEVFKKELAGEGQAEGERWAKDRRALPASLPLLDVAASASALSHPLCLACAPCRGVQGMWQPRCCKRGQAGTLAAAVCQGPGPRLAGSAADAGRNDRPAQGGAEQWVAWVEQASNCSLPGVPMVVDSIALVASKTRAGACCWRA